MLDRSAAHRLATEMLVPGSKPELERRSSSAK
jgi:hypothetical protein